MGNGIRWISDGVMPARRSFNVGGPARRSFNVGGPARRSLDVGGPARRSLDVGGPARRMRVRRTCPPFGLAENRSINDIAAI